MSLKVCGEKDCPVRTRDSYCDKHRKARRRQRDSGRPSAAVRGYGPEWRKVRESFLRANPYCIDCGAGATVPDHAPLTRAELVAQGVQYPDAHCFLLPRCKSCHDRKTAREDGGFGRQAVSHG